MLATVETIVSVLHRWQKKLRNVPRKKAQLLHLAGIKVQGIYEDLSDPGPVNADADNEYFVLWKLDAHFASGGKSAVRATCFSLTCATQGETTDKFMVCLSKEARHCNFEAALEENVWDEFMKSYLMLS